MRFKFYALLITIFFACIELTAQTVVVLPGNNSTSANGRAPQGGRRFVNTKYIITAAQMTASGFSGAVASVGWRWNVPFPPAAAAPIAQSIATTGTLKVYLKDTVASAVAMSGTFIDTSGVGYTKVIDGTISIPAGLAEINIDVPAGGPGTSPYTPTPGNAVLVIFVYQTTSALATPTGSPQVFCTNTPAGNTILTYQSQTVGGTVGTTSTFRPETRFGITAPACAENFDAVTAPALPFAWNASTAIDCANSDPWVTSTSGTPAPAFDSPPNSAFVNDPNCISDELLDSRPFPITSSTAVLTFRNNYDLENGFDGMVLEISIGGGPFTDIIAAGGSFGGGGYNGVISAGTFSPIGGRNAWTGSSAGFITTTVNLPAAANGQTIILRWRRATDISIAGAGVRIDDISISGSNCLAPLCTITCPANVIVSNDPNQCGAIVTFPPPTTSGICGPVTATPASGTFFQVGTTTVNVTSNGGGGSCSFTVRVNDTQVPTLGPCPANIVTTNSPGICGRVVTFSLPTASDNCPGVTVSAVPASGSTFPVGVTTVTVRATDASGNLSAPCTFTVTVNDTQSPTFSATTLVPEILYYKFDGTGTTVPNLASAPPAGTATATIQGTQSQGGSAICNGTLIGSGVSSTTDFVNTGWATNLTGTSWTISFKTSNIGPSATLFYIFGDAAATTFRCFTNGVAGAGNWMIRGPVADVIVNGGATVAPHTTTFVYSSALGNIRGYLDGVLVTTVTQAPPTISGAGPFKVGGYATGNIGLPLGGNMDEFAIFNRALSPAEVLSLASCPVTASSCPANITVNNASGTCGAVVTFTAPVASDNCPGVTTTLITGLPSGSTFPVGVTTNTYRATDAAGNTAVCTFTVTVRDVQAPVITCPAPITATTPLGICTAVVNYNVAATDNCAGVTTALVSGPASGSAFPIGTTAVTWMATDASGNTSLCSFNVTVNDGQLPVISVQPANRTVCVGTNAVFSVTSSNAMSYQWQQFSGGTWSNIAGATGSSYTVNNVTTAMNTNTFRVMVVGLCTTITSGPATLFVNTNPIITLSSSLPPFILPGQSVDITATGIPPGGSFVWLFNGVVIPGVTSNVLTNLTVNDLGSYSVRYTDQNGCVTTSAVLVLTGQSSDNLWVYPNPNFGQFQVRFFNGNPENATVNVYNSNGARVYQKSMVTTLPFTMIDIDLGPTVASGMYLVELVNGSGKRVGAKQIIVRH